MSMRTWAPTTPNVRGVARHLWRGLATQLGACMWKGPELPIVVSLRATCRPRMGAQYVQVAVRSGKGRNPVICPESLRCRCSIAFGEVNTRLQSSLSFVTVLVDQSFFSRCCGISSDGGVDTSVATFHLSCGAEVVPLCGSILRGTTCGSRVWPLFVDTSAAWSRTHST